MDKKEHLLTCLAEECAEVQQAVAKALRFGLDDGYPGTDRTNEVDLFNELNDLFAVVEMLHDVGIWWRIDSEKVAEKKAKIEKFMLHAEQRGTLTHNMGIQGPLE